MKFKHIFSIILLVTSLVNLKISAMSTRKPKITFVYGFDEKRTSLLYEEKIIRTLRGKAGLLDYTIIRGDYTKPNFPVQILDNLYKLNIHIILIHTVYGATLDDIPIAIRCKADEIADVSDFDEDNEELDERIKYIGNRNLQDTHINTRNSKRLCLFRSFL